MSPIRTLEHVGVALLCGGALLLSGCFATAKHVATVEGNVTRQGAWLDEQVQTMQAETEALRAENETLRLRVDDLSDQLARLGGDVSGRLAELANSDERTTEEVRRAAAAASQGASELEAMREKDRQEVMARMNAILDEVVKENERLASRLQRLEQGAFTFGRMHKVQPGETIASIAGEYGVSAEEIAAANGLANANLINVGQELLIPGVSP